MEALVETLVIIIKEYGPLAAVFILALYILLKGKWKLEIKFKSCEHARRFLTTFGATHNKTIWPGAKADVPKGSIEHSKIQRARESAPRVKSSSVNPC